MCITVAEANPSWEENKETRKLANDIVLRQHMNAHVIEVHAI